MCEYCGCRQIPPLSELMDEHIALLDLGGELHHALGHNDQDLAHRLFDEFATKLAAHSSREEAGVFTALRDGGDYVEEISQLEDEHRDFTTVLTDFDLAAPDAATRIEAIVHDLADHVDKEDNGIFPVSVVTLGRAGWDTVTAVHASQPTFLEPH